MRAWPARLAFTFLVILSSAASAQVPTRIMREPLPVQPGTATIVRQPITAGTPPAGLSVTGTPYTGQVSWQPATGAASYVVTRWFQSNPSWYRATSPTLTTPAWTDNGLEAAGAYVYHVVVNYADGKQGSADVTYQRPEPHDPSGFTAAQTGEGEVQLTWQAVPGVSTYLVGGPGAVGPPGAENQGLKTNATTVTLKGVPVGSQQWTVASWYEPGGLLINWQAWPKASTTVAARSGRYRIVLNGFTVTHATTDDVLSRDGKWDEVYGAAFVQLFDRKTQTQIQNPRVLKSQVNGDVWGFSGRVQAGTASGSGGLQGGDHVPGNLDPASQTASPNAQNFPLLLFEGPLTDGSEAVVIRPTLWEFDGDGQHYQKWSQYFTGSDPAATIKSGIVQQAINASGLDFFLGGVLPKTAGQKDWNYVTFDIGPGQDRYIGMRPNPADGIWGQYPEWTDHLLVFTREKIEAVLSSAYQVGSPGIVAIPLIDANPNGSSSYEGDYTLYLRVERLP